MTKCPNCFRPEPPDQRLWRCTNPQCEVGSDDVASAYAGRPVDSGPLLLDHPVEGQKSWQKWVDPACNSCGTVTTRACVHCHWLLPGDWFDSKVITIAMSGARATGKSFYIAVVVAQLRQLLNDLRSSLEFVNRQSEDTYRDRYWEPLYVKLGMIAATASIADNDAPQRYPLIFSLGRLKKTRYYLAIRDVAGEDLENPPADLTPIQFLRNADALFFMFDPLAVPAIANVTAELLPTQSRLGGSPVSVLANLNRIIGDADPALAVIVSKFDSLQALAQVDDEKWQRVMSNPGSAFLRDPSLSTTGFDAEDAERLNLEVRSILLMLGGEDFVYSLENSHTGRERRHKFFAVSVLGDPPVGENVSPFGITPYRVLDPLKWVLAERGAL